MEHLSLEIFDREGTGSQFATLPDNTEITITDTSEVFASGDVWSWDFQLNTNANLHIFGTSGELHGSRLHEQVNKRRARLWVEDLPLYLGYLKLADEVDVDGEGNVSVSFESGQKTFDEMIQGANANQVPLMDDVMFGMALWRKRWVKYGLDLRASANFSDGKTSDTVQVYDESNTEDNTGGAKTLFVAEGENESVQEYPRMVFPKGHFINAVSENDEDIDCVNTDHPYDDEHPYCNVALCYQRYGYMKTDEKGSEYPDYSAEPEPERGYEVMPANRVNSAPNFFVIYWLRCLMQHLGIYIEENQMTDVEDLRRLFFVNTKCAYKVPERMRTGDLFNLPYGGFNFDNSGRLVAEHFGKEKLIKTEECKLKVTNKSVGQPVVVIEGGVYPGYTPPTIDSINVTIERPDGWRYDQQSEYKDRNSWLHYAYATSECFPNVSIEEVIKAIESGFGVRFLFNENYKRVRIVLLRNIFGSADVQDVACDIISTSKKENGIRGFRMTYGNTEDTHFYYKGFADALPHKKELWPDNSDMHDYSQWKLDETYAALLNKVSAFNKTCYVTPNTGNAFIIKVDKDAKRYSDLHPSLFGCADFMDAEDGDCTGDDETIETVNVGFTPAIMNDLNMDEERGGNSEQRFALFVDEKMRVRRPDYKNDASNHEFNDPDAYYNVDTLYKKSDAKLDSYVKPGEFAITSDMEAVKSGLKATITMAKTVNALSDDPITIRVSWDVVFGISGSVNEGYRLYLQDNYEPNDDGISPIETHDWGLTMGIMRGSGSDATINRFGDSRETEENDTWELVPGSNSTAHPDTCDCYGNLWDYNGDTAGVGTTEGRVSLKLRAEKPNPYFDPTQPEDSSNNRRYLEITAPGLEHRGLADQFYKEYSHWVRNARIAVREVRMELAQLLCIDKTKRVRVGDVTGFIRKMQYSVSKETGLGNVTMEIMYI